MNSSAQQLQQRSGAARGDQGDIDSTACLRDGRKLHKVIGVAGGLWTYAKVGLCLEPCSVGIWPFARRSIRPARLSSRQRLVGATDRIAGVQFRTCLAS